MCNVASQYLEKRAQHFGPRPWSEKVWETQTCCSRVLRLAACSPDNDLVRLTTHASYQMLKVIVWKRWKSLPTIFEMCMVSVWNSPMCFVSVHPLTTLPTGRPPSVQPRIQHKRERRSNMDSLHRQTEPSGADSYKTFYPFPSLQGGWINASIKAYQCHFITDSYQNDIKVQAEEQTLGMPGDGKSKTHDPKTWSEGVKWFWELHTENRPTGFIHEIGHSETGQTAKNNLISWVTPTHPQKKQTKKKTSWKQRFIKCFKAALSPDREQSAVAATVNRAPFSTPQNRELEEL